MSDDTLDELERVLEAMKSLYRVNPLWSKNLMMFSRMTGERRYYWWERAKRQSELGAPAMQALVLETIKLRLTQ
jgi:hypothetical protein